MNPADIHYLRSEQGVTIVVTQSGEYWASYPLAEMEEIVRSSHLLPNAPVHDH